MRAIITVVGRDTVGIIARVSDVLWKRNANVLDISQSVLEDLFAMVMLVDITGIKGDLTDLSGEMDALSETQGLKIHVMHEDIFNSMHRI